MWLSLVYDLFVKFLFLSPQSVCSFSRISSMSVRVSRVPLCLSSVCVRLLSFSCGGEYCSFLNCQYSGILIISMTKLPVLWNTDTFQQAVFRTLLIEIIRIIFAMFEIC